MKMKLAALAASFVLAAALAACGGSPSSAPAQSLPTQPSSAAPESAAPGSEADSAPETSAAGETEIKGTGESISGYKSFTIHYEDDTESAIQRGVEGLTYTLEGVQVFDSIKDAGVDMYGCTVDSEDILGLPFVLVELKADYTAPTGGEGEVIADANDLTPMIQMARLPRAGLFQPAPQGGRRQAGQPAPGLLLHHQGRRERHLPAGRLLRPDAPGREGPVS